MRAVKSVSIDSERRVIITFLDGSTETLYPNCIWCDLEALRQLIKDLLEEKADAIVQTINNVTIASFADGADEARIKKLLVSIEPIQEGTGDPSPENVRPITGRTGLSVVRSGKNLLDDTVKAVNESGTNLYIGADVNVNHLLLTPGTYTLSCKFAAGVHYGAYLRGVTADQKVIWGAAETVTTSSASFTITKTDKYRLWFYLAAGSGGVSVDGVSDVMLNVGDKALPYKHCDPPVVFPINWQTDGGTVYGGSVDIVSGKLVVDRVMYNLNTSAMNNGENYPCWKNTGIADIIGTGIQTASYPAILNIGKSVAVNTTGSGTGVIYLPTQTYIKTQSEWIAEALDVQILFDTINPIEYQLTPQEITTLLGTNNIWVDNGDILELEYVADTKLYVGESQSGTLGSGRQSITKPEIQPISETVKDVTEAEEKETQEETEDERGE